MSSINEIKRLLRLSELAGKKVQFNWNGTKVINPMQQGASNRIYSRAYKIAKDLGVDIVQIHREVINER